MEADDKTGLNLAWAQTFGTFFGLGAIGLAFFGLLIERIRRVRADDERLFTSKYSVLGCFHSNPVPWWASLWGHETETLRLPTITGLIEVGDRGAWTSSALDLMTENHPNESWVKLYESIMTSIESNDGLLEKRWSKEEEPIPAFMRNIRGEKKKESKVAKMLRKAFLERVEKENHDGDHVSASWKAQKAAHQSAKPKLFSLNRQLERPLSATSTASVSPRSGNRGLSRLTSTWVVRDKACIGVTREELAALTIIMGVALPKAGTSSYVSGVGAFGLSIDINHADATWSISVVQGSRLARHAPSMGSGYSTLMAKHLACGSVPFAKSRSWILSVYVTDDVLKALKAGGSVIDKRAFGGDSLEFLRRLPGDMLIDAFYGTETTAIVDAALGKENNKTADGNDKGAHTAPNKRQSGTGDILHANGDLAGKWSRAVTEIAFGGLVPQANPNVVSAVKFTVGGSNPKGCVESLEGLIDKMHNADRGANLFGDNVQERCHASGHAFVNYTFPDEHSNPTDAAAIFSRYSNLLERVVARTVGQPRAFGAAVYPDSSGRATDDVNERDIFEAAASHIQEVYEAAVVHSNPAQASATNSPSRAVEDLGNALEGVIKNFRGRDFVPLHDCVVIFRCVLAAWAFTVPLIEVRQAPGHNLHIGLSPGGKVPNEIVMANLPPVSALC